MRRHLIERLTDTQLFRLALVLAGTFLIPVLGVGLTSLPFVVTFGTGGDRVSAVAFVALAIGGAIGLVGWIRAIMCARTPERHSLTITLTFLAIGSAAAVGVSGFLVFFALESASLWLAVLASSPAVWVLGGIGWMQRLPRICTERTGRPVDALPVTQLLTGIGLALAAVFIAAGL